MKSSVQEKINHMLKVAAANAMAPGSCINANTKPRNTDSLSLAIRNKKEADQFLEDIKTAFERANRQNKNPAAL